MMTTINFGSAVAFPLAALDVPGAATPNQAFPAPAVDAPAGDDEPELWLPPQPSQDPDVRGVCMLVGLSNS